MACHAIDLVIVNGENAAGGNGITREIGDSLLAQGVDVITSGNHIWDKREALDYIKIEARLLRPANYPDAPGRGSYVARTPSGRSVGVLNVMGRVHMANIDDPFRTARREIEALRERTPHHLRRLPRRGHVRENRDGLVPRRLGHRRRRHAHPRADRG